MPESADRTKIQSEEIASLRSQLRDAKEILHAIRTGKADALVVARNGKDVVYTLENADKPFRLFIEEMQEGAVTVDEHGLILYANRRFASFVETSLSSVIGSAFYDYVCAADRVIVSNFLHNKTGQGEKIEVSLCANHRLLPVFLAASPFLLDDAECEKLLCIVITDLSPQREVEAAASLDREWKNRYEAVIRASGHLLYDWNPQTNEIIFGGDTERTLGYTAAEMSGSLEKWKKIIHPDDRLAFTAECQRVATSQTPFSLEYRVLHRDGRYLHFEDDGYPLRSPKGRMTSIVGFRVDITARKLAEEKIQGMNAELEERVIERTAELEEANNELQAFCYSVSHDLRSPLRSVTGFCQALLEEHGEKLDASARDYMQRACNGARRMGQLIDDLLRLSQISRAELRLENIDLSALAKSILAGCKSEDPKRQIKIKVAPKLALRGDSRLIQIALENLLSNAWKFTGKKSKATIEFGATIEKGLSVFFIRDNGDGFDMAYAEQLFGVFHRLHSINEFPGTGIGLAIVNRIIQRHGGRVWANANRGEGATFYFTVPD